jgi:peptide/nickel transport system permease protein
LKSLGYGVRRAIKFSRRYPMGAAGIVVLLVLILFVLTAGMLTPYEAHRTIAPKVVAPLNTGFDGDMIWLGSDELGRDIFTRLQHGGRTSLVIGLLAPLIGTTIGALLGITSAYRGGTVDLLTQRLVDVMIALPGIVLAMAIVLALGFSLWAVIMALAVTTIGGTARVVRSHALAQSQMEYVDAARALGASDWRIVLKHLLPNSMAVTLVLFTVGVGASIVAEAGLSFIGLGVQPPTPSWGNMLTFAQNSFRFGPHIAIIPGLTISIVVLSINLVGDALRDALDPHLRGRG